MERTGIYASVIRSQANSALKLESGALEVGRLGDILAFLFCFGASVNAGVYVGFAVLLLAQFGMRADAKLPRRVGQ